MQSTDEIQEEIYEGLELNLKPTPLFKRMLAYSVDYGIVACISYVVLMAFGAIIGINVAVLSGSSGGFEDLLTTGVIIQVVLMVLTLMAMVHTYFIYYEYKKGRTPGKKLMGLRVVTLTGEPPSLSQCFMREMFRYIDMILLIGIVPIMFSKRKQRFGDMVSSTMVIYSAYNESENDFIYIDQSDYLYLKELLRPRELAPELLESFKVSAYGKYILKEEHILESYFAPLSQYIEAETIDQIDQNSLFLFFAEHIYQEAIKNKE